MNMNKLFPELPWKSHHLCSEISKNWLKLKLKDFWIFRKQNNVLYSKTFQFLKSFFENRYNWFVNATFVSFLLISPQRKDHPIWKLYYIYFSLETASFSCMQDTISAHRLVVGRKNTFSFCVRVAAASIRSKKKDETILFFNTIFLFVPIIDKKVSGKSKDEQMAEKKQELEKRLQDVTGQLGSGKKATKKGNFVFLFFCAAIVFFVTQGHSHVPGSTWFVICTRLYCFKKTYVTFIWMCVLR